MNATALVEGTEKQKASVHYINSDTVYTDIMGFLKLYDNSPNTKSAYERDIRYYFQYLCKKNISHVTKRDVEQGEYNESLLNKHANEYKEYLKDIHDSETTIIRMISTIRTLYKHLQINGYKVNHMIFNTQGLEPDTESYDNIPFQLIVPMSELAKNNPYHGNELSVFIICSAQTSVRVSAMLKLTKKNLKYDTASGYHTITVKDKGRKTRTCPIDATVHGRLLELVESGDKDNQLVFQNIKSDWIRKAIQKMTKSFPELEGKNITTHSLRHTAPTYSWEVDKDIKQVMLQTDHKSVEIAMKTYVSQSDGYESRAGVKMFMEVNENALDSVSKEELIEMIKEVNYSVYHSLLLKSDKK